MARVCAPKGALIALGLSAPTGSGSLAGLLPLAALALALGADSGAAATKPPPCAGGGFELSAEAGPLVPGGAVPDVVLVGDDGSASIASGCPRIAGKLKTTRKGTRLKAKWTRKKGLCAGLTKKASLKARFDETCEVLSGKFKTKGRKIEFTATRAGVVLEGHVPTSIHGEPMRVAHASGAEMLATDAAWADVFAGLGASADGVEVETASPSPESALDLHAAAWTVSGAGWAQRIAGLGEGMATHPESGYVAEERDLAGRPGLVVTVPEDERASAAYYLADGDTLLLLTSGDAALVEEVLAELPAPAMVAARGEGRPLGVELPVPGTSFLVLLPLLPVVPPVCVAEPFGRVRIDLIAIDLFYGLPVPAIYFSGALVGETLPDVAFGIVGTIFYRALVYVDGASDEQVTVQAVAPAGGQGTTQVLFPVRHCLNGIWLDGDLTVQIDQIADHFSARIVFGTLCGEEGGFDFTGDFVAPDQFQGSDLKVCSPEECVDAGFLPASTLAPYTAVIAVDGNSADITWENQGVDFIYDGNRLVGCTLTSDVDLDTFTIERLAFGPDVP